MIRHKQQILLWLVVALFLFPGLGGYDLSAPDEPRFGLVAREMMEDGHWLLPHRNGRAYPDKPPLFFWSIAGTSYLSGGEVTAWSARLPSALSALAVLLMMYFWSGKDERGPPPELVVLILLTGYRFFFQARMAQIDMLLCCCVTAAMVLGHRVFNNPTRRRMALIGLFLGLGTLAKGPVAYLLPLGAWCIFVLFTPGLKWKTYPKAVLLWGLIPPILWIGGLLIQVAAAGEWDYLQNLLFKQTITRYLNPWHHYKPFYYFLRVIITDFLPWSPFLVAAIPFTRRARAALTNHQRYAWAMVVFTLVFFSLSKGKRDLYILPLYPFASYLVACRIRDLANLGSIRLNIGIWAASALAVALAGLTIFTAAAGWLDTPQWTQALTPHGGLILCGLLATSFSCFALLPAWKKQHPKAVYAMACAMFVIHTGLYHMAMPAVGPHRSARRFMTEVNRILAQSEQEPLLGMVVYRSAYRFYGEHPIVELQHDGQPSPNLDDAKGFLAKNPRGWLIIRKPHWEDGHGHVYLEMPVGRGTHYLLIGPHLPSTPY